MPEHGYYYIVSNLGTVLDVSNGSTVNGTNVQTPTLNKTNKKMEINMTRKTVI